jgi:DNA polymerase I-like protein with 3'-5' exonuclease and polymerase domains
LAYSARYPLLHEFIRYRTLTYAVQHFSSKLPGHIHPLTKRIHPNYHQLGAATGRFSCTDPNLQGLPKKNGFRECAIPEPKFKLVIGDYSQIELRVAAEISGDPRMLRAYQNGHDLHRLTASLVAQKSMEEVTREERQSAKAINFGLIFGMGEEGLQKYARNTYGVNMTREQARFFRNRFFQVYQGITRWHEATIRGNNTRETRTIIGRRRLWKDQPLITELLNTPIQGTSADITKKALGILPGKLIGTGAKIIGTVHDEIILEVPEEKAESIAEILKTAMIEGGRVFEKSPDRSGSDFK